MKNLMTKSSVILVIGVILMASGAAAYLFVQQPFTDCPSFMGLAVGAIPKNILDRCQASGFVQITGSAFFIIGIGLTVGGAVTKYSSS